MAHESRAAVDIAVDLQVLLDVALELGLLQEDERARRFKDCVLDVVLIIRLVLWNQDASLPGL